MSIIEIKNLTKDYGNQKGIFDVTFSIEKGEVFGFLGPNGAGKTTTIRHLMGFIEQESGNCSINGFDCKNETEKIQSSLGYLPGEIAFMYDMTGVQFIRFVARMKGCKDLTYAKELMHTFELDPARKIKKMSKGMKQKIGIVCAFMNDPDILILDEPTSGLDPLMQNRFVDLILQEKKKGKTILMSSHMVEEVAKTCDRIAMIKEGKIVSVQSADVIAKDKKKKFTLQFESEEAALEFSSTYNNVIAQNNRVVFTHKGEMTSLIRALNSYRILDMEISTPTLVERFIKYYGGNDCD